MSEAEKDAAERRTDEAFERSAWADPRAAYRTLLRRLRETDSAAFERAVEEYEAAVVTRLADPAVDPVAAWLDYGEKLARRIGAGRTVRIDSEGRSEEADGLPDAPALVLHLPTDESAPAIVVAAPREPSAAQGAAMALLADGRTGL